jgi:PAS domain S-box-containing protein
MVDVADLIHRHPGTEPDAGTGAERRTNPPVELFDENPVPMVVTRLHGGEILAVNARTSVLFGLSPDQLIGRPMADFYQNPADRERVAEEIGRLGHLDDVRLSLRRRSGEPLWIIASARLVTWNGEAAILAAGADMTDQVAVEQALAASQQRLAEQSTALTALTQRSADASGRFETRLEEILRVAAETLQVGRLSVWRFDEKREEIRCISLVARRDSRHGVGTRLRRDEYPAYFAALDTDRVIDADDAFNDPRTRGFASRYLEPNEIGAMLDVPLRQTTGTLGVLCAEHIGRSRIWTLDEQNFALSVANLIALAVADEDLRDALKRLAQHDAQLTRAKESAEQSRDQLDRELESAGRMQQLLLPKQLPTHPAVRFLAHYRTCRHAGGDYYDVLPLGDDRFAIVVADVSGHGASAAIVMAMLRAVVHTYDWSADDPREVLSSINKHFRYLWDTEMYATAVAAVFDAKRRTMRIASAGHPPPILARAGEVSVLPVPHAPLLLWDELGPIESLEVQLLPGDRVVFYTDGVTDRPAADDSRFDLERLLASLADGSALTLVEMMDLLSQRLDAFGASTEPDDDQTVLALEVTPV